MFRAVWTKTLREYRVAILGWGLGLGLLILSSFAALRTVKDLNTLAQFASVFRFFGDPVAITTPGGYVTLRIMSVAALLLSIWTALAGARMLRGDEERAALDVLLATPQSRRRVLLEKVGAMGAALLLIALLTGALTLLGQASSQGSRVKIDPAGAFLAAANVSLTAILFGLLALAISQFVSRRGAASGLTLAIMAAFYLIDATGRIATNLAGLRRVSPFFYYGLSKPLVPSYGTNAGALGITALVSLLLLSVSVWVFPRRDIGGVFFVRSRAKIHESRRDARAELDHALRDISVRTISGRALASQLAPAFWWLAGLAAYAIWMTLIARGLEAPLRALYAQNPSIRQLFAGQNIAANAGFIAVAVYLFLPAVAVLFALTQATTWPTDLDSGRIELIAATPLPRWRVALERFSAVFMLSVAAAVTICLAVLIGAAIAQLKVDTGRVIQASLGILPLELLAASVTYLLAGRLRSGAIITVIGIVAGVSYFAEFLKAILHLPSWLLSLSVFHLYGSPLTDGLHWGSFVAMLALAGVLLVLAVMQFARGDLDRGG